MAVFGFFASENFQKTGGRVFFLFPQWAGRKIKKVRRLEIRMRFPRRHSEESSTDPMTLLILPFPCKTLPFIYSCMGTENSDDVIVVTRSRASVRRFIKDYLAIKATPYWFHQTLTFKDAKLDEKTAKGYLIALLDSLRKQFPKMPPLFVQERQRRQGLHYHVIFMLFGPQPLPPEETRLVLEDEIFPRWKAIAGGKVVQ
ncbi:MAG: rolling circle replication-associated protein, partial [Candidatus Saccharimonadales bacterium]